jgi:hypothetical protein
VERGGGSSEAFLAFKDVMEALVSLLGCSDLLIGQYPCAWGPERVSDIFVEVLQNLFCSPHQVLKRP